MKKIKILYITHSLGLGGQEKQLFELIKNIGKNNIIFEILSLSNNIERKDYFSKYNISFDYCKKNNMFYRMHKIFEKYQAFKPDIIHSFDAISNSYLGLIRKMLKLKCIGGFNASYIESKSIKLANMLFSNYFDRIICNSYAGFNYLKDECKIKEEILRVIENGIDYEAMKNPPFIPKNLKDILKREITFPVVGLIGKLDDNKDPMVFVKAAKIVHEEFSKVIFCIIGDGPYQKKIEDFILEQNMKEYFFLIPKIIDAPWIIKDFYIGTLSSRYEGFPNVILEYMYWEKPVVTTNAGDCARIVDHGVTGYVLERGDYKSMAIAIKDLLTSKEKAKSMGKNGRIKLEKHYKIERYAEQHLQLYKEVVSKN